MQVAQASSRVVIPQDGVAKTASRDYLYLYKMTETKILYLYKMTETEMTERDGDDGGGIG